MTDAAVSQVPDRLGVTGVGDMTDAAGSQIPGRLAVTGVGI